MTTLFIYQVNDRLVGDDSWELLGLINHTLNLDDSRNASTDVLCLVNLSALSGKISRNTMSKFLYSVNSGSLKKLRELRTDALDSIKVSMICPGKNKLSADTGSLLKSLASSRSLALLKKLI